MEYQLEVKQLVTYPRCRIYRKFIRSLMRDTRIRSSSSSYLFFYTVLSSYANFRTSYRNIEGVKYIVYPGEWICTTEELKKWFRTKFLHQAVAVMEVLQKQNLISYTVMSKKGVIKYKILDWPADNTILEYNYPCQKGTGFFFLSIHKAAEILGYSKCSEMEIVLDLWLNAIYNDDRVRGSNLGPVVYFRDATGNPQVSTEKLAQRWRISKATAHRALKKLEGLNLINVIPLAGKNGSVIYLKNYLSTMFELSDVMVDKDEVALELKVNVKVPKDKECMCISFSESHVSEEQSCVSKTAMEYINQKLLKVLKLQGVACVGCEASDYILSKLSDCKGIYLKYHLTVGCQRNKRRFCIMVRDVNKLEDG